MRVTHVITRLIVGGAQENTVATVLGLQQARIRCDLISGPAGGPEGSLEGEFAARPDLLRILPSLVRPVHPAKDRRALRELTGIFRETRPDIVHTHSGKAGVLGRLAAHRAGVPIIVHTIHGPSFGAFQGAPANLIFRTAERVAGKVTTHFIAVAQAMTDQYLAADIGRASQYTRIFSGFDLTPFRAAENDPELRGRLGIAAGDIVIGKVARLFKLKGHDDLFTVASDLVKRFPQIKFLLVGDGEWRRRFENRGRKLGLENHLIFAGLVPPREVARYVGIMDVLVHLSAREGLPRALPQGMAAGKPVIAYDCDGAREVCLDGETGFLVKFGNHARLAECVGELVCDAALRARLGCAGQNFVLERFPIRRMVEDIYALYCKLIEAGQSEGRG